ncbi:uncharacterized protein [Diabrotica undecimpunctata]|uniref:uncharacterized protein isoform X2 n=1 Tax=Diabrotica undecimpunctata TaxID=50387 RepID=UPI003B640CD7
MSVSGFGQKSDKDKLDLLLYLMGNEAEDILLQNQPGENASFQDVMQIFDNHFIPRRNTIFERFQFNSRVQRPGEPVGNFISSLHTLAEHCSYGALKDELIRDRIVIGIADKKVSERMQLNDGLTLEKAIQIARQAELQDSQNRIMRQEQSVSAVKQDYRERSDKRHQGKSFAKQETTHEKVKEGYRCGYCGIPTCKNREKCPAKFSECRSCSRRGHWSVMCRKKAVRAVKCSRSTSSSSIDDEGRDSVNQVVHTDSFIGQVYLDKKDRWYVDILLDDKFKVPFFVDTGADANCFPYEKLLPEYMVKIVACDAIGAADDHKLDTVEIKNEATKG